jgi:hypothetical protein
MEDEKPGKNRSENREKVSALSISLLSLKSSGVVGEKK